MSTTYHDYASQTTVALRLARLRLHMGEIEAMLSGPDVSADGKAVDRNALEQKMARLQKQEAVYVSQGGDESSVGPRVILTRRR